MPGANKNNLKSLCILPGVTAILGSVQPAVADVITTSTIYNSVSIYDTQSGPSLVADSTIGFNGARTTTSSIEQFDSLGGTRILEGVELVINNYQEVAVRAYAEATCNNRSSSGYTCNLSSSPLNVLFLAQLDFGSTTEDLFSIDASRSLSGSCEFTETCTVEESDGGLGLDLPSTWSGTITDSALLAKFIGTGTYDFQSSLFTSGGISASSSGVEDVTITDLEGSLYAHWYSETTVNYTFSTVDVPEPMTWLLFASGLTGFGMSRRKKK
ncbi:PEP-CTERM sorting domain-containing protein [Alteromonas sp. ASW11-130]|uniref:PEP-CTERM sorting domain-containing protein n=1 Tax=Alteromonas sp. ASW11-130 TaxID=3015775 RepID=UPI0022422DE3|nr:PEP-CTERM sorting domain-containing protein [Alteromonas sp. ASW11-130]MCW8092965.1 PEP-CTERM sorting domain-containing protein [Alteromonas sp. ASW11-130]